MHMNISDYAYSIQTEFTVLPNLQICAPSTMVDVSTNAWIPPVVLNVNVERVLK